MKKLLLSFLISTCLISGKLYCFNQIVAFGDSLSCTGNACIYSVKPASICNIYPQGRFTDGKVWLEVLANEFQLPEPKASLAGGLNFAYGGATTGWSTSKNLLNVGHQIEAYLNRVNATADSKNLFVLWAGGNDIKNNIIPSSLLTNIKQHITDLAHTGAKTFLVPNFPPLTQTPLISGVSHLLGLGLGHIGSYFDYDSTDIHETFISITNLATESGIKFLNKELKKQLRDLEKSLKITIYYFDTYTLFYEVKKNLRKFNLNSEDHLFIYDGFHPSAFVHKILGMEAFKLLNAKKQSTIKNKK